MEPANSYGSQAPAREVRDADESNGCSPAENTFRTKGLQDLSQNGLSQNGYGLAILKVLNDWCAVVLIHHRVSTVRSHDSGIPCIISCFNYVAISQRAQADSLLPCFAKCRERDRFQISHKVCEIHPGPLHLAKCEVLRNLVDELRV